MPQHLLLNNRLVEESKPKLECKDTSQEDMHLTIDRHMLSQNKKASHTHLHKPNRDTAKQENECVPPLHRTFMVCVLGMCAESPGLC